MNYRPDFIDKSGPAFKTFCHHEYFDIYNYDIDVNSKDKIISLITCTRYFGLYGKTQFRVDARMVRENEKIVKYKIETNQNYDIIK